MIVLSEAEKLEQSDKTTNSMFLPLTYLFRVEYCRTEKDVEKVKGLLCEEKQTPRSIDYIVDTGKKYSDEGIVTSDNNSLDRRVSARNHNDSNNQGNDDQQANEPPPPPPHTKEEVEHAKELWVFLHTEIYPYIFNEVKVYLDSDNGTVTFKQLTDFLDVSDEAIVLLSVMVKQKEFSALLDLLKNFMGEKGRSPTWTELTGEKTEDSDEGTAADSPDLTASKKKRKRGGGRMKGANLSQRDLEESLGWYAEVVQKLGESKTQMRQKKQDAMSLGSSDQACDSMYQHLKNWNRLTSKEQKMASMKQFTSGFVGFV